MNRPDNHLVAVSPAIKAHPLWAGSNEEMAFNFGGVTYGMVREMISRKERADDLTPNEVSWLALWKEAIK